MDSSVAETDINTVISSEDKESVAGEILYNETETEFITVPETETVKESDIAINKETEKLNSENDVKNNAEEAEVGDVFRTYFGKFRILTVGDNPTVAIIGDEQMDDDGNFWYGDPSQPWTAIYLDVTYAVTTISCHISGNKVAIPEGVECIVNQVFKFNATKNLILPSTLKQFDEDHAHEYLETITVAEGNQYYKSVDNVLFTKDGKKLLIYPAKDSRECYSTPEETETIAYGAFYKNHNLKILDLTNIKTIEKHSIYGMQNIETIKMASSLENFDPTYNFYQCDTLQNVYDRLSES